MTKKERRRNASIFGLNILSENLKKWTHPLRTPSTRLSMKKEPITISGMK